MRRSCRRAAYESAFLLRSNRTVQRASKEIESMLYFNVSHADRPQPAADFRISSCRKVYPDLNANQQKGHSGCCM